MSLLEGTLLEATSWMGTLQEGPLLERTLQEASLQKEPSKGVSSWKGFWSVLPWRT